MYDKEMNVSWKGEPSKSLDKERFKGQQRRQVRPSTIYDRTKISTLSHSLLCLQISEPWFMALFSLPSDIGALIHGIIFFAFRYRSLDSWHYFLCDLNWELSSMNCQSSLGWDHENRFLKASRLWVSRRTQSFILPQ